VISADPDAWYLAGPKQMGREAYADYRRAIHNPATVHAPMEDYRAGLGSIASTTRTTGARDPGRVPGARPLAPATTCRSCTAMYWASGAAAEDLPGGPLTSGYPKAEEALIRCPPSFLAFLGPRAGLAS
jgi:haloacetate dehalogenase